MGDVGQKKKTVLIIGGVARETIGVKLSERLLDAGFRVRCICENYQDKEEYKKLKEKDFDMKYLNISNLETINLKDFLEEYETNSQKLLLSDLSYVIVFWNEIVDYQRSYNFHVNNHENLDNIFTHNVLCKYLIARKLILGLKKFTKDCKMDFIFVVSLPRKNAWVKKKGNLDQFFNGRDRERSEGTTAYEDRSDCSKLGFAMVAEDLHNRNKRFLKQRKAKAVVVDRKSNDDDCVERIKLMLENPFKGGRIYPAERVDGAFAESHSPPVIHDRKAFFTFIKSKVDNYLAL